MLKGYTKEEKSWMMYDWANSAHSVIVVTILPIFYNTVAGYMADSASGMSTWGYATSAAMAIVALLAPVLGVFGDFRGMRKKLFVGFMLVGVVSCALMAATPMMDFMEPGMAEKVGMAVLALYILSTIGFAGANLYYDSFLNDVTTEDRMDKVSTMGYGMGYIGGSTIPLLTFLILNLVLGSDKMLFCLSFAFGLTAVWWLVFSIPFLKNVHQIHYVEAKRGHLFRSTFQNLWRTAKDIFTHKRVFLFIIAYFFYIDGVNTIISVSTSYGTKLGLDTVSMILALLATQIVAMPFSILFGKLAGKVGSINLLCGAVGVYFCITLVGFFMGFNIEQNPESPSALALSQALFWCMAFLVGTVQGGIQALSRSYFGKLIPPDRSNEYFGFFDIFGKFAAVIGPLLVGLFTQFTGRDSIGVISLAILFLIGEGILVSGRRTLFSTETK